MMPGTTPAMNSAPIEVLVETRVDHHHDRRRDQDAERARGRDDAGAEALRKALLRPSPAA
jgi:hypothetical protein